MISFVWTAGERLPSGTGGSENYTIGQVRELVRRGVPAQVVTIGVGTDDGREEFPGIPFRSLRHPAELSTLGGTIVFVTFFDQVELPSGPLQMLHVPPPVLPREADLLRRRLRGRRLVAPSRFAATVWADFLGIATDEIHVVYPFAEPEFGTQPRLAPDPDRLRLLYAGRLSPEKGIFTLVAMLHNELFGELERQVSRLTVTVTDAGSDKPQGEVIRGMLAAHPRIDLIPARRSARGMAALMAAHDIVVMPSNNQYWFETFGIVSVEAQHTGSRVVASHSGGLPETDCGGLLLVEPDNPAALALGIADAVARGPMTAAARAAAATRFTVGRSVDQLLAVVAHDRPEQHGLPHGPGRKRPAAGRRVRRRGARSPLAAPPKHGDLGTR